MRLSLMTITVVICLSGGLCFANKSTSEVISRILKGYSDPNYKFDRQVGTNSWIVTYNSKPVFLMDYGLYLCVFTPIAKYSTLSLERVVKALYASGYYDSRYNEYGVFSVIRDDEGYYILIYAVKINSWDINPTILTHAIREVSMSVDRFYKEFSP